MGQQSSLWLACLLAAIMVSMVQSDEQIYRMCVPQQYYDWCLQLLKDPSEAGIQMECVAGRDRIECLDMINQRKADVLATEPEDMYVAYHTKNQDYRVISEIRTKDDKDAEFRYEGIILVKKNSNIHSLKELRGAKSCHTGFGRNVGFKIPITKLKNANILKVTLDPDLTATERELKALSEFFSQSCLVGTYSPYPETDRILKKKYSNLCALCEKPQQCNYPDIYSGYDGAIRCLDQGKGDVAFTKVQYIKKYFGLSGNTAPEGSDPTEFEYLCEDGTRRPITGAACSWAQRPWTGYISNADSVDGATKLHNLQQRLEKFFENGLHAKNKEAASHLLINENAVYYSKPTAVEPKEYLERAGYKDVIERDGSVIRKMKMCVRNDIEFSKCDAMRRAAYSRDIRPELECVQEKDCMQAVKQNKADLVAIHANEYKEARAYNLKPIIYESYGPTNVYVAVVEPSISKDVIQKSPINYDATNERAKWAAAFLNKRRSLPQTQAPSSEKNLQIVNAKELEKYKNSQLLCPDLERKPVTEFTTCNFETNLPIAVFIRESMTPVEQETIKHLFVSLSSKFGKAGKLSDIFALFGEYQKNKPNVIFDDDAVEFVTELKNDKVNEQIYNELTSEK